MKTSQKGIDLIKSFEGLRLKAYLDSAKIPTIGYGHTKGVKIGDTCTQTQAEEYLKADLTRFEYGISDLVKVPLTQNQFDALVCFTFNVGLGAFQSSTMRKLLNNGNYKLAAEQFSKWNKAGGVILNGLVKRRQKEKELFLT